MFCVPVCMCKWVLWSIIRTQSLITHTCSGILLMRFYWRKKRQTRLETHTEQLSVSVHQLLEDNNIDLPTSSPQALSQNVEPVSMYVSCQRALTAITLTFGLLLVNSVMTTWLTNFKAADRGFCFSRLTKHMSKSFLHWTLQDFPTNIMTLLLTNYSLTKKDLVHPNHILALACGCLRHWLPTRSSQLVGQPVG